LAVKKFPAKIYAFTEDDCTIEPDWLIKIETALAEGVGSVGGPDLLPFNMGWFPTALDRILDSPLGRVGAKGSNGKVNSWYFPRKENIAVPVWVFEKVGQFREDQIFGAEMDFARMVREAGLKTVYLADNPVWHKRNTTIPKLLLRNYYMAEDKVRLMRETGSFTKSFHFLIFILTVILGIIGFSALFFSTMQIIFMMLLAGYFSLLLTLSVSSAGYTGRKSVGFGVFFLAPLHHLSIVTGILKGVLTNPKKRI
jgi:GT2 family glycosyltransferase